MIPSRQALLAASAFALVACGAAGGTRPAASPAAPATASKAADLRVHLDSLLTEHVLLGARVTDAALGGRSDEYAAYAGLLTHNTTDLGGLLGGVLGTAAQNRIDQLWAAHDTAMVQYAAAIAAQDRAVQNHAAQQLDTGFVPQFADLFAGAAGLSRSTLTGLARSDVQRVEQVADDQARKNWTAVYADVRAADSDIQDVGDALAAGIVRKQARRVPGSATDKAVGLRATLARLLVEHAYLATGAAGAAIGGRTDQLQAAAKALDGNGADLGKALGADVQGEFDKLWSAQDGSLVDYATAVARSDRTGRERTALALNGSVPLLAKFLAGATGMSEAALARLLRDHVATTRDVMDAQGRHDVGGAARRDRLAAQRMAAIGDGMAAAIVRKLPQKFQ